MIKVAISKCYNTAWNRPTEPQGKTPDELICSRSSWARSIPYGDNSHRSASNETDTHGSGSPSPSRNIRQDLQQVEDSVQRSACRSRDH